MMFCQTTRQRMIAGGMVAGLAVAGAVALAAQDIPPGPPAPAEPEPHTHSGIVVDLVTYLEKREKQREQQRDGAAQPPGIGGEREGAAKEDDHKIDWKAGHYRENLEAGVPAVLLIEEDSPWGDAVKQPHVIAFDPKNPDTRDRIARHAGERIEVSGEIKKPGARRGLSVVMVDEIK